MPFKAGSEGWRYEVRGGYKCDRGAWPFAWRQDLEEAKRVLEEIATWDSVEPRSLHIRDNRQPSQPVIFRWVPPA